ncbi:hypothetical protein [Dyella sp. C11]|uniref:hypothetical protein n=1 Tax=Dyella sp. C11 TaxID=2126991 RepID=UPI000D657B40|nr:hypothetical protein [Dyella sp. C11]
MTTRSKGPAAGFGWLKNGFNAAFSHPKPLLGGAALLLVACFLPTLITMPFQYHAMSAGTPPSPIIFIGSMVFSMLFGLALIPLYAGYLQLVDAAERGLPSRASDIFKPYRDGNAWRLIGYGVAMFVVYMVFFGLILAATGGSIVGWYMQAIAAQASHQLPPALPAGFGITVTLFMLLGLLMMGFYAISLGQVALRQRSVISAMSDGLIGALKNALPLLVFALSVLLAWIVVTIAMALVVLVLALVGKLVAPWLALVLIIPIYIAVLLTAFTVGFGAMYHLWRDVCDDDVVPDLVQVTAA